MKLGIGAGAIYATTMQGVWSNTTDGTVAATKIKERVLPQQTPAEQVILDVKLLLPQILLAIFVGPISVVALVARRKF